VEEPKDRTCAPCFTWRQNASASGLHYRPPPEDCRSGARTGFEMKLIQCAKWAPKFKRSRFV
jgi:hypothetical protein